MGYTTRKNGEVVAGPFIGGMNNKAQDYDLPEGVARNIVNGDISNNGRVRRRKGSSPVYNGLGLKGGFSCDAGSYFIEGTNLCKFNTDETKTVLFSGVFGTTFTYDYFNGIVYFSDGLINKKIIDDVVYDWGLPSPYKPVLVEVPGSLSAGTYIASYSWVDSNGVESGASDFQTITLNSQAGIMFFNLPGLIPGAVALRIYLSASNGRVLYHVTDTLSHSYSLVLGRHDGGSALELAHVSPPPAGNIIGHYNGRMYISTGKITWYSEPYSFDHFRFSSNYLLHTDEVQLMIPVANGIYFISDKATDFYSGNPEDGFTVTPKFSYGGIYGTSVKDSNSDNVFWMSNRGLIKGSPDGQCVNMVEQNIATETGDSGSILVREQDGLSQVISIINNPTVSTLAAASFIEAEVVRRS